MIKQSIFLLFFSMHSPLLVDSPSENLIKIMQQTMTKHKNVAKQSEEWCQTTFPSFISFLLGASGTYYLLRNILEVSEDPSFNDEFRCKNQAKLKDENDLSHSEIMSNEMQGYISEIDLTHFYIFLIQDKKANQELYNEIKKTLPTLFLNNEPDNIKTDLMQLKTLLKKAKNFNYTFQEELNEEIKKPEMETIEFIKKYKDQNNPQTSHTFKNMQISDNLKNFIFFTFSLGETFAKLAKELGISDTQLAAPNTDTDSIQRKSAEKYISLSDLGHVYLAFLYDKKQPETNSPFTNNKETLFESEKTERIEQDLIKLKILVKECKKYNFN